LTEQNVHNILVEDIRAFSPDGTEPTSALCVMIGLEMLYILAEVNEWGTRITTTLVDTANASLPNEQAKQLLGRDIYAYELAGGDLQNFRQLPDDAAICARIDDETD
jgi:hypothetical protein